MTTSWYSKAHVLTGLSGSGKTTAAKIFASLGACVINADALARKAVEPGSPALEKIKKEFSTDVLLSDGSLNREKLSAVVFKDPKARKKLEAIIHPVVATEAAAQAEGAIKSSSLPLIYDCPLLFETGLNKKGFKSIILIVADEETCIKRIMTRDKISRKDAMLRLQSQLPKDKKISLSDVVIENNADMKTLEQQIVACYQDLL